MSLKRKLIVMLGVIIVAALTFGLVSPAKAADGSGSVCPTSPKGNGSTLVAGATIQVLSGDMASTQSLLTGNGTILCVGEPSKGFAFDNGDGTVAYGSFSGSKGTDSFTVGATDNEGNYYTTVVTVEIEVVNLPKPKLVKKLVVNKKGKVVRKAVVRFSNPSSYKAVVLFGSFKQDSPDGIRKVGTSKAIKVTTKRGRLDFVVNVVSNEGNEVLVMVGTVNTKTGKTRVENLSLPARKGISARRTSASPW